MCSGSSTSTIKASVNAPGNQQHHPSYDNAACAGSVISTACHPPSRFEESLTSTLPSTVGRDQEAAPKPDGRTQSNTTSILLASTPSMPPSWYMTDPSGRPLFADCQRWNPSMALKSSKSNSLIISSSLLCLLAVLVFVVCWLFQSMSGRSKFPAITTLGVFFCDLYSFVRDA